MDVNIFDLKTKYEIVHFFLGLGRSSSLDNKSA